MELKMVACYVFCLSCFLVSLFSYSLAFLLSYLYCLFISDRR